MTRHEGRLIPGHEGQLIVDDPDEVVECAPEVAAAAWSAPRVYDPDSVVCTFAGRSITGFIQITASNDPVAFTGFTRISGVDYANWERRVAKRERRKRYMKLRARRGRH